MVCGVETEPLDATKLPTDVFMAIAGMQNRAAESLAFNTLVGPGAALPLETLKVEMVERAIKKVECRIYGHRFPDSVLAITVPPCTRCGEPFPMVV